MSILPESWHEWEWHVASAQAAGVLLARQDARLWRMTVSVASTGTTVQVQITRLPFALETYFVLPGTTLVVEPLGMQPATVDILAGADFVAVAEYIHKSPPLI